MQIYDFFGNNGSLVQLFYEIYINFINFDSDYEIDIRDALIGIKYPGARLFIYVVRRGQNYEVRIPRAQYIDVFHIGNSEIIIRKCVDLLNDEYDSDNDIFISTINSEIDEIDDSFFNLDDEDEDEIEFQHGRDFAEMNMQGFMTTHGYTVNAQDGLSENQRQSIIATIIANGEKRPNQVAGYLMWCVRTHSGRNFALSRTKWLKDLDWLRANYEVTIQDYL